MCVKIYNSLSRSKEEFEPLDKPYVKITICGPTLYDYMHLGHARLFVILDIFARYLEYQGYKPLLLIVLTDIDPKIFKKARALNMSYKEIVDRYMLEFEKDLALLNVNLNYMIFAKASDHAYQAYENVLKLMNTHAYLNRGNVYFDTSSISDYGILVNLSRDELESKPIDLIEGKRNVYDFMIWNGREEFEYHLNTKILGKGLPWWHMQDASIALTNFGSYDLHAGARELIYPHHEAQRALLKVLGNEPRYWFHIGLLTIDKQKMGKSQENTINVRDMISKYGVNTLRAFLLSRHYREDLEFDPQRLEMLHSKIKALKFGSADLDCLDDDLNTEPIIDSLAIMKRSLLESIMGFRL